MKTRVLLTAAGATAAASNVCPFASYTSYSDALTFAQKNFGGEGKTCSC